MAVLSAATFSVRSWTKTSSAANALIINMIEAVRVSLNVIIAAPVAATSRAVSPYSGASHAVVAANGIRTPWRA
jgi:hypothetical protein